MDGDDQDLTQLAADVLIGAAASFDPDATDEANAAAFEAVIQRLAEVDAVVVGRNDEGTIVVEMTPLLTAATASLMWLADRVAIARGSTRLDVLTELGDYWRSR